MLCAVAGVWWRARWALRRARQATAVPAASDAPDSDPAFGALDPERDLTGIVVDDSDQPVPDAVVVARTFDISAWWLAFARGRELVSTPLAETASRADGRFRLTLPAGEQTTLRVVATGFAVHESRRLHTGEEARIVLTPATTLRVRVQSEDGTACVGAALRVRSLSRAGMWLRSGTTDRAGAAAWDGLPRGEGLTAEVIVRPGAGRAGVTAECALEDRAVNDVVVTLPAGRTIEGVVLDVERHVGVGGALVFSDPREPAIAVAGPGGRFRIEGWPLATAEMAAREARVVATAAGFALGSAAVPAEATEVVTVRVRRGFEARASVVDVEGVAIAGAQVLGLAQQRGGRDRTLVEGTTDAAGRFRVGWFERARGQVLRVSAPGLAPRIVALPPAAGEETLVDLGQLVLLPGRTVRVRVVDSADAPRDAVRVSLRDPADANASFRPMRTTQQSGLAVFANVPPGRQLVHAILRGPGGQRVQGGADVDVPTDADPDPVTVVLGAELPKPPGKVVLRTRILDEDGVPVPGVPLGVNYHSGGWTGVLDGANGAGLDVACQQEPDTVSTRFMSNNTYGSTPASEALARRYLRAWVLLRPGQTAVDVVLRRGEPVGGIVIGTDGKPLAQAWVDALVGAKQVACGGYTDADGRFEFAVPRGATVELVAKPQSSGRQVSPDVGVASGVLAGSGNVTIRVEHVATDRALDVSVVRPADDPGVPCTVTLRYHGQDNRDVARSRAAIDADGRARFEGLPGAPIEVHVLVGYDLTAHTIRSHVGLPPVWVGAEAASVTIVVPAFRTVHGRVVDAAGRPSAGAYLSTAGGGNLSQCLADDVGVFALRVAVTTETPFPIRASKFPFDREKPFGGWDVVDDDDPGRELVIVLKPQPPY